MKELIKWVLIIIAMAVATNTPLINIEILNNNTVKMVQVRSPAAGESRDLKRIRRGSLTERCPFSSTEAVQS